MNRSCNIFFALLLVLLIGITVTISAQDLNQSDIEPGDEYIFGIYDNSFPTPYQLTNNLEVQEDDTFKITIKSEADNAGQFEIEFQTEEESDTTQQFLDNIGSFALSYDWTYWEAFNDTVQFQGTSYNVSNTQSPEVFRFDLSVRDGENSNYTLSYYKQTGILESLTKIRGTTTLLIENQFPDDTSEDGLYIDSPLLTLSVITLLVLVTKNPKWYIFN